MELYRFSITFKTTNGLRYRHIYIDWLIGEVWPFCSQKGKTGIQHAKRLMALVHKLSYHKIAFEKNLKNRSLQYKLFIKNWTRNFPGLLSSTKSICSNWGNSGALIRQEVWQRNLVFDHLLGLLIFPALRENKLKSLKSWTEKKSKIKTSRSFFILSL